MLPVIRFFTLDLARLVIITVNIVPKMRRIKINAVDEVRKEVQGDPKVEK